MEVVEEDTRGGVEALGRVECQGYRPVAQLLELVGVVATEKWKKVGA